jgi:phospholipid/cholesterol/gamma-HCH transport system permease protein
MRRFQALKQLGAFLLALRRAPVRRVWFKQVYFTGNEAGRLVALIGFSLGSALILLLHGQYGQGKEAALRLMVRLVFTEFAPLFAALVLVARSSSAVASELAAMRVNRELAMLLRHGISLQEYLIAPRVYGMTCAAIVLSATLALCALLGGLFFASGWDVTYMLLRLEHVIRPSWCLIALAKAALFGFFAAVIACRCGLMAAAQPTEIPKAASKAVMRGLASVFALEFIWVLAA